MTTSVTEKRRFGEVDQPMTTRSVYDFYNIFYIQKIVAVIMRVYSCLSFVLLLFEFEFKALILYYFESPLSVVLHIT
jgi:hypothetical protein